MFFPHKPKAKRPPDESLVPHGLIWQAMTQAPEPTAPDPVTPAPAQPSPSAESSVDHPARRMGAISPPIPWPSPKVQEIVRRPHTQAETEQVAVHLEQVISAQQQEKSHRLPPARVPKPEISPSPGEIPPPTVVETVPVIAEPPPAVETPSESHTRFHGFRERWRAVGTSSSDAWREVRADIRTLYGNIHLVERMRQAGELLRRHTRTGLGYLQSAASEVATESKMAINKLRVSRLALSRPIESWSARSAAAMGKVWHQEIHVDMRSEAWSRPITALRGRVSRWKSKVPDMRVDSHVWTSVVMAAMSAAMVLGMISLVRPYRPRESSPHPVASPQSPAKQVKPTNRISRPNGSRRAVVQKPNAARPAAPGVRMPAQAKTSVLASGKKMQPRKSTPHTSKDADYVAHDTYVYYGANGKTDANRRK